VVKSSSAFDNSGLLVGLLGFGLVTLKVTNQIDWSWWWVLGPVGVVAGLMVTLRS
jgi:hypothetical protein